MKKKTKKRSKPARAPHWSRALVRLGACIEAVKWARGIDTYAKAWRLCTNPPWLRWLLDSLGKLPSHHGTRRTCLRCLSGGWSATKIRERFKRPELE